MQSPTLEASLAAVDMTEARIIHRFLAGEMRAEMQTLGIIVCAWFELVEVSSGIGRYAAILARTSDQLVAIQEINQAPCFHGLVWMIYPVRHNFHIPEYGLRTRDVSDKQRG